MPTITRPHKTQRTIRIPGPLDREVATRAAAAGMSYGEMLAALLAFALGGYTLTKRGAPH